MEGGELRVEMKLGPKRPGFLLLTVILEGAFATDLSADRQVGSKKTSGRRSQNKTGQSDSLLNCLRKKSVFHWNTLFLWNPFPNAKSLVTFMTD